LAFGGYRMDEKLTSFLSLLDLATGKEKTLDQNEELESGSLAFTSDGKFLLAGYSIKGRAEMHVWDLKAQKRIAKVEDPDAERFQLSPGGLFLGESAINGVRLRYLPPLLEAKGPEKD